ncbi:hypothetical protein [Tardiphaga robiniae]|uniref:hypothetical protein n=1 Tax=Tardiphaga robiniae TaxID=943830 RepID=UPI001586CC34|nr:hypothetical protein [Tardiphaga robiniae]NUU41405.1 hypothetical protein [Tardiphaga robiniae]
MLTALLRSDHGREVLFAIMGDAKPRWFVRYRKALDANALERQMADTKRMINQLREESSDEA